MVLLSWGGVRYGWLIVFLVQSLDFFFFPHFSEINKAGLVNL